MLGLGLGRGCRWGDGGLVWGGMGRWLLGLGGGVAGGGGEGACEGVSIWQEQALGGGGVSCRVEIGRGLGLGLGSVHAIEGRGCIHTCRVAGRRIFGSRRFFQYRRLSSLVFLLLLFLNRCRIENQTYGCRYG